MIRLQQYLTKKVDYLKEFDDPDFGELYNKHKAKFYLNNITTGMLAELGLNFQKTDVEYDIFKGYVYMFGRTISDRKECIEIQKSKELQEIIKNNIGKKLSIIIKGQGILGNDIEKASIFKIIQDSNGEVFLMPPRTRRRGYKLNAITILNIDTMVDTRSNSLKALDPQTDRRQGDKP
jgi:hypothetical protein